MKTARNLVHRTKTMELTTTSRQRTTALNRLLTTTASAVRISMGLPLLFAFKSISIYLIAILAILCVQCIDCNAIPLRSSSSLLSSVSSDNAATAERISFDRIAAAVQINRVANLTRQYSGDVFSAFNSGKCEPETCVGLSSGTASMFTSGAKDTLDGGKYRTTKDEDDCRCQCLPHLDTFREDLNICVDDIHECTLAPFVSGSSSEKIPFVFLPLRGQIIHPSKEISFQGIKAPVCAISGSQYLTPSGWTELRNAVDLDIPFRLFRDESRTFLQWLGESELRSKMQGRLVIVHLMCRDIAPPSSESLIDIGAAVPAPLISAKSMQTIFTPCVAFRVAGMPIKHINNVTEVLFQAESTTTTLTLMDGLSAKEYILIAICSLILGLIYVASVFLYIHVKRYKTRANCNGNDNETPQRKSDYQQNDEVTFGNGIIRSGYDRSSGSINGGDLSDRHGNLNRNMSLNCLGSEEHGVIKSNPLLKHYPNLSDNCGFISDMSGSALDCADDRVTSHEVFKSLHNVSHDRNDNPAPSPTQETECLPEENVSIIEDMTTEDKLENMKAIVSGTMRRKLYFNPAYFEPHLLVSPPPAAIEFLSKIREVITLAKYKMATKRFQPSLIMIPEEKKSTGHMDSVRIITSSKSLVVINDKNDTKSCIGCPGCSNDKKATNGGNCKNCGDKRNSIRKWLEGVSKHESDILDENEASRTAVESKDEVSIVSTQIDGPISKHKSNDSSSSSDSDTIKANSLCSKNSKKRKAPPIPSTAPKIINYSIKPQPNRPAPIHKPINVTKNIGNSPASNAAVTTNNDLVKVSNAQNAIQLQASKLADENDTYNNLSLTGTEIYNNPQFKLSSPPLSHRSKNSRNSNHSLQSNSRKRLDVLDQYANPAQLTRDGLIRNTEAAPDMLYEAIATDPIKNGQTERKRDVYGHLNVPAPDYDDPDSIHSGKCFNNYENDGRKIPPPDYNSNTLGRKQYQPDSPIYHRKSPHYLIVDYETDSLERSNTNKVIRNSFTPHSNNSSDMSSHPSPSLSSALPLEEEVEIGNTVYDRVEGYRKDGDPMKMIRNFTKNTPKPPSIYEEIGNVSKAYLQSSRSSESSKEPRIKYNTPFLGSMTIEVEHEPTDEELSTDSDQFEPDTLDRKPKKFNNIPKLSSVSEQFPDIPNNQRNLNDWPSSQSNQQVHRMKSVSNKEFIESNMSSLPDMSYLNSSMDNQVVLRSSGSFKSNSLGNYLSEIGALMNNNELEKNFSSLREIYEAKNQKNLKQRPGLNETEFNGRLLTLEARHSRRQRQTTLDKNMKKILPSDVIPPDANNIYDSGDKDLNKNVQKMPAWNNGDHNGNMKKHLNNSINGGIDKKMQNDRIDDEANLISESLSSSSNSENTDVTGVSDHHNNFENNNSLKQAYSQVCKTAKCSDVYNLEARRPNELQNHPNYMNLSDVNCMRAEQPSDCNSDSSTLKTGSTKFFYKSNLNQEANNLNNHFGMSEDLDKIEIVSSKSLRLKDIDAISNDIIDNTKHLISELANDTSTFNPQLGQINPTKVFHVEILPPTNGMQIALGIRDRVKKTKDLKQAWKKFVNMATWKFQSNTISPSSTTQRNHVEISGEYDLIEKTATFSDTIDRDDGIASMSTCADDSITTTSIDVNKVIEILSRSPSTSSSDNIHKNKDLDYGYISADSNESKAHKRKMYARFNFKTDKSCPEPSTSKTALGIDWRRKHLHRMQEIKENTETDRNSAASSKSGAKPLPKPKPIISAPISTVSTTAKLIDFVPKNISLLTDDAVSVRIYSSSEDDERYSSGMSSESDGEYNVDELCESGAESIETHSVLFKNIRKLNENN